MRRQCHTETAPLPHFSVRLDDDLAARFDAVAAGRQAAFAAAAYLTGGAYQPEKKQRIPAGRLSTAYFKKCHSCDLPAPGEDYLRCISCGTCRDCHMCMKSCPENAITRVALPGGGYEYVSDSAKCIGCGICAGVCPCGIWTIYDNAEPIDMYKTYKA